MAHRRPQPHGDLPGFFGIFCLLSLMALGLFLMREDKPGVRDAQAVSESEPSRVLLVYHKEGCRACERDKPIVDSMLGKVNMTMLSWDGSDRASRRVYRAPTYILLTESKYGHMEETWRTYSAMYAREWLGLTP